MRIGYIAKMRQMKFSFKNGMLIRSKIKADSKESRLLSTKHLKILTSFTGLTLKISDLEATTYNSYNHTSTIIIIDRY